MFCKHEWQKVNQFETESVMDIVHKIRASTSNAGSSAFVKKYITDYTCKKCGKLKRFIVKN